jgi:hypothetical protein
VSLSTSISKLRLKMVRILNSMQQARMRQYDITTCFHETMKTVNKVQNVSVKYIFEHVRKRVVTGDGTNSSVNAADCDSTVASSAAIQLNVAMLRLGERKQPAIGVCEIIVDKDAFINSRSCIVLVTIEHERPRLVQTVV